MRLLKDKRGQVRVIEAFLASILLMSMLSANSFGINNKGHNSESYIYRSKCSFKFRQ